MVDQLLSNLERWTWDHPRHGWAKRLTVGLRVLLTVIRGLYDDRLWLHAGYMTYLSLLHLVPIGALTLAISTRLGWQSALMRWVQNSLSPTAPKLAGRLVQAMDRMDLTALGYAGLAAIIIAGVFSLTRLEKDLAAIWNAPLRRRFWQRLLLYPSALVLIPTLVALLLVSGTIAEARTTLWIQHLADWGGLGQWLYQALTNLPLLFRIVPFLLSWAMLTFVYWLGTSAPVERRAALWGGLVGAVIWQAAQTTYLNFQFATSTYHEVRGYFAQIPLLLIWIYASWVTFYIGAEFTFAWQHRRAYLPKAPLPRLLSPADEEATLVAVMCEAIRPQATSEDRATVAEISGRLKIPLSLVTHVSERLTTSGVLYGRRIGQETILECSKDVPSLTVSELIARCRRAEQRSRTLRVGQIDVGPEMTIGAIAGIESNKSAPPPRT